MIWSQPGSEPERPPQPRLSRRSRRSSTSTAYTATSAYTTTTDSDSDQTQRNTSRSRSRPRSTSPVFQPIETQPDHSYAYSIDTRSSRDFTQPSGSHISATPQEDELILSAQPQTPIFPPPVTSQTFSDPSSLPSPPASPPVSLQLSSAGSPSGFDTHNRRPRGAISPAVFEMHSQLSPRPFRGESPISEARGQPSIYTREPSRQALPSEPLSSSTTYSQPSMPSPTRSSKIPLRTAREVNYFDDDDDDTLLNSVLDGIGRMSVTMGQDGAGRWRIKRTDREF